MNLVQMNDNEYAIIKGLPSGESGQRLEALGLRAGKRVHKISGMPWGGPITLELDGRHFAVAHNVAAKIEVEADTVTLCDCGQKTYKNNEM